jgi:hypothetical protein
MKKEKVKGDWVESVKSVSIQGERLVKNLTLKV